jgi:hypothetical protein
VTDTRRIDPAEAIAEVSSQRPCDEIFFRDHHSRAAGYKIIARAIIENLAS